MIAWQTIRIAAVSYIALVRCSTGHCDDAPNTEQSWSVAREDAPVSRVTREDRKVVPVGLRQSLRQQAEQALQNATRYFVNQVAVNGGYVYTYSVDLQERRGEGVASPTQIWVQPPGTPTVGMAMLRAYEATGDKLHLNGALAAARALIHGQLVSGGWTDSIDFDPTARTAGRYRNGGGRAKGRNYSTLDDNKTQSALRLLMQVDRALEFRNQQIHEAALVGLNAVLQAQFPNGGFPQGWQSAVPDRPVVAASYPEYDWRTEGRIKEYWDHYTLNDGLAGTVSQMLWDAYETYDEERYLDAMKRLGDFLILAQMPEPQPAWAQQYNVALQPMWARKFEPAAIAGRESEDVVSALMFIFRKTGDERYLKPIPAALKWMQRSLLPDGQLARFYELQTNRPLYMKRRGDVYTLTYDDSDLPSHYGFKTRARLEKLQRQFATLQRGGSLDSSPPSLKSLRKRAEGVIASQDDQGRWITTYDGTPLPGQPRLAQDALMISSRVFSDNVELLSDYLNAARAGDPQ